MNIYELTDEIKAIQDELYFDETNEQALAKLAALKIEADKKIEYFSRLVLEAQAFEDACHEALLAQRKRHQSSENVTKRLRELLLSFMRESGIAKHKGEYCTVSISKPRESLLVTDESLLPEQFVETVTSTKIDKASLKEYMKDHEVKGAEIVLGESGLMVRK